MKEVLKNLARAVGIVVVFPALVSYRLRAVFLGRDRALTGSSQALGLLPGVLGQYVRRAFYMRVLAECHPSTCIEFGVHFSRAAARLGENVYVGPRSHIGLAHIGRDVLLATGVHVPSGANIHGTGEIDVPIRDQKGTLQVVSIGEGTWVGSAAVVMADVGRHAIIGAGAVVTRPVPDYAIAGGVPARVIRDRRTTPGPERPVRS
jgi:acetyltransferase-like isoleucine patch superfamily enzyme